MTTGLRLDPERWQRLKSIVADALEREPPERESFVVEHCGGDTELLEEVRSMLAHANDRLDVCADQLASGSGAERSIAGQRVGAYEIVREIARGGMGAVYLARRADKEFEKEVAIKILKRGTDTEEVLRRFQAERQILARLEHPNIAHLLDAGTTNDGLPYFVMEYVDGARITDFCTTQNLSIRDRVRLFLKVCAAVHFAHRNLVVHRDLKPGNILITPEGEPKLLDFGIAKLLSPDAEFASVTAPEGQRLTAGYASPEQVRGEPVTTVSDVYSLGALLFEMLAGIPPHIFSTPQPSATELFRVVVEQESPRGSLVARIPEFGRELRGDLDNILSTALRKQLERRYSGVTAFADDLRRYLDGRPVRARNDTVSYRASKFIRRHKLGVAATAVLVLTLLGGIAATAWQARRARIEERRAEQRFDQVRKLAHSVLFDYHDSIASLPGSTSVRERLVKDALEYLDNLSREVSGDRGLLRELAVAYQKVGQIQGNSYYVNLGDTAGGMKSYRRALEIHESLLSADPDNRELQDEMANSREGVGDMLYTIGDLPAGLKSYESALELRQRLVAADKANVGYRIALSELYAKLGDIKGLEGFANLGDTAGALADYQKAEELLASLHAEDPQNPKLGSTFANVLTRASMLANTTGDVAAALGKGRTAVAISEQLAASNPNNQSYRMQLLGAHNALRYSLVDNNEIAEAVAQSREIIAELEAMAAADPKDTQLRRNLAVTCNALGKDLLAAGDAAGALANHRRALTISEALFSAEPNSEDSKSDVAFTLQRLGEAQAATSDYRSALDNYRKALGIREATLAADPANARAREDVASILADLGNALAATGDLKGATENLNKAISLIEERAAETLSNTRQRARLAVMYLDAGKACIKSAQARPGLDAKSEWQRAREHLARSLGIWEELRDQGKLVPANANKPDEVSRELARCERALQL